MSTIVTNSAKMTPPEKVTQGNALLTASASAPAVVASAAAQAALAVLKTATTSLSTNQQSKKTNDAERVALDEAETVCVIAYDAAFSGTIGALAPLVVADPKLPATLQLTTRATRTAGLTPGIVQGLAIKLLLSGVPQLYWLEDPGASMYTAEMSPDPPTDATWTVLYGKGTKRTLDTLVVGQKYVFRVCAVGSDGHATAWSASVGFTGVVPTRQKKAKA